MGRAALAQAVAILDEEEAAEQSTRYVDLCVSLRLCDVESVQNENGETVSRWLTETDEELLEVGGVWDKREKKWTGAKSDMLTIIRIHRGQAEAARELAAWLDRRRRGGRGPQWTDFKRYWTLLLVGGRRGGKTHLSVVALALFLVMVPRCRCFAVSPTLERGDELEEALKSLLPRRWYKYRGGGSGKSSQFTLVHGSRLLAVSGHKQGSLKVGKIDLALYNEGQQMSKAGWVQLRGGITDKGGMVIVAANPPDAPIGRWIEELYDGAVANENHAKAFTISPKANPFIEYQSLADMAADINDERTFRREVLGEFVPIGDVVMHAWRDTDHWRDPDPAWEDITVEFTREHLGRPFGYIVGMDFQLTPAMVATVCKVFRDPEHPEDQILAIVDEVVVEKANEDQLVDGLESSDRWTVTGWIDGDGYRGWPLEADKEPIHCAVVMDASGFFQPGDHGKGPNSDLVLKARRWTHLYRPQKDSDRNPLINERCKATNAQLKNARGRRRLVVAKHCAQTARAMRLWETRNGLPYRRSPFAHLCDCVGYVVYRFWARPKKAPLPDDGYVSVRRFNRRKEMEGF